VSARDRLSGLFQPHVCGCAQPSRRANALPSNRAHTWSRTSPMRGLGASDVMASSFATGGTGGGLGRKIQVQKPPGAHQNKRREHECRSQKRGRTPGCKGKGHHPATATAVLALSPLNIANIQTLLQQVLCSSSKTLLQQVLCATVKRLTGRRLLTRTSCLNSFYFFW
jgi:hypothetical protein